jgi:hypothetical protein
VAQVHQGQNRLSSQLGLDSHEKWKLFELKVEAVVFVNVTESFASALMTVSDPTCVVAPNTAM